MPFFALINNNWVFIISEYIVIKCFRKRKCLHCDDSVDSPVKLPCRHVLCLKCVVERKELEMFSCPDCDKAFPPDFKAEVIADKKWVVSFYIWFGLLAWSSFWSWHSHFYLQGFIKSVVTVMLWSVICVFLYKYTI